MLDEEDRRWHRTYLIARLEDEYHETPHRGLEGETPLTRWAATAGGDEATVAILARKWV